MPLKRGDGSHVTIDRIDEVIVPGSGIRMAEHCFSCTAGEGSGCGGSSAVAGKKVLSVSANSDNQGVTVCYQQ
jgi:hypothetical protein